MPQINFRDTGTIIRQGQLILAASFNVLDAERLKNNHKPGARSSAWPAIFLDISDIEDGMPDLMKPIYGTQQIENAWQICDLYSKLQYSSIEKKLTLRKARTNDPWKKLGARYSMEWFECRRISDTIICHLMSTAISP